MTDEEMLFHLAASGQEGDMRALLATGVNVNIVNEHGWTPLMVAAMEGDPGIVACLIEGGASIFSTDRSGHTPLILAARKCRTEIVRVLIEHSRRLQARSAPSVVSLYAANSLDAGCPEVARMLRTSPA